LWYSGVEQRSAQVPHKHQVGSSNLSPATLTIVNKMEAKKKTFIEVLKQCFGNISKACDHVGISRTCYYKWLKEDEEFKEYIDHIDEYVIDEVENHLLDQIKDGNTPATIFYLKTKAKHRGYVEKQEVQQDVNIKSVNLKDLVKFE
jgi:enamine deaminase RidA (YjgF/YER057c/UK114 family)